MSDLDRQYSALLTRSVKNAEEWSVAYDEVRSIARTFMLVSGVSLLANVLLGAYVLGLLHALGRM